MLKFIMPSFLFKIERWKWNSEYRVYVSNMGHFKDEHKRNIPIRIDSGGYVVIYTSVGWKKAHRLVMLTWKPIPNAEEITVDHLDHNKRNNNLDNLEWVSYKENLKRANRDLVKVSTEKVYCVELNMHFNSYKEAAEWLLKNDRQLKNVRTTSASADNIAKKIKKAITNKKHYGGREWKII